MLLGLLAIIAFLTVLACLPNALPCNPSAPSLPVQGDTQGTMFGDVIKIALPSSFIVLVFIAYKLWKCCADDGCTASATVTCTGRNEMVEVQVTRE